MLEKNSEGGSLRNTLSRVGTVTLGISGLVSLAHNDSLSLVAGQESKGQPPIDGKKEPGSPEKNAEATKQKFAAYRQAFIRGDDKNIPACESALLGDGLPAWTMLLQAYVRPQLEDTAGFRFQCWFLLVRMAKGKHDNAKTVKSMIVEQLGGVTDAQAQKINDLLTDIGLPVLGDVYETFDRSKWDKAPKADGPEETRRTELSMRAGEALQSMIADPDVIPDVNIFPRLGQTLSPAKKETAANPYVREKAVALLMSRAGGYPVLKEAAKNEEAAQIIIAAFTRELAGAKKGEFYAISQGGLEKLTRDRQLFADIGLAHPSLSDAAKGIRVRLDAEEASRKTRLDEFNTKKQ